MIDPLLEAAIKAALIFDKKTEGVATTRITLACDGLLISGEIISAKEYMQSNELFDMFDEITQSPADGQRAKGHLPSTSSLDSGYVHLKKARFVFGASNQVFVDQDGHLFWRAKLDSISGFSLCGIS